MECNRPSIIGRAAFVAAVLYLAVPVEVGARQNEYRVGPHDVLTVSVFGQPPLSGKYTVEADGSFSFPLVGRVKAAGLTQRSIEELLRKRLADGFLKQPQVSVTVEQYRSQRIFVIGEIRQSGEYNLSGETTIMDAIARAGSPTADASGEVVVLRPAPGTSIERPAVPGRPEGSTEILRADLDKLRNGELDGNVTLRDGDTVYLPRGEKIYVYGQVRSPGAFTMPKNLTVLQALSLAGGATERAATNRLRVARIVNGERKEFDIKLPDPLRPGDTLIVPERYF
jgi:polysaccharide export outer membrane protein